MSSPSPPIHLSPLEKCSLLLAQFRALNAGLWAFLLGPFRGKSAPRSLKNHVILHMIRAFLRASTIRHHQYLQPHVSKLYADCAKKNGFPQESITLEDGTKAYWIGSSKPEKVILWCHGGGYSLPASPGHFTFLASLNASTPPTTSVLFLAYTLAPHAVYPAQLTQGVALLRHLLHAQGLKPQHIMLGGDSAGANLTLGVLSHLSHPHPSIAPLELAQPLRGVVLLSPWTSFGSEGWGSVRYNRDKDTVIPEAADLWSSSFLGGKPRDRYNEPMTADAEWWEGLRAEEVLVVGGGDEILVDSIRAIAGKVKSVHPKTELVIIQDEFHDQPTMVGVVGTTTGQADVIKGWVAERL